MEKNPRLIHYRWVLSIPFFISCIRQQNPLTVLSKIILRKVKVGSINSIFYFLHKAAEPFNCLEQDNLA